MFEVVTRIGFLCLYGRCYYKLPAKVAVNDARSPARCHRILHRFSIVAKNFGFERFHCVVPVLLLVTGQYVIVN